MSNEWKTEKGINKFHIILNRSHTHTHTHTRKEWQKCPHFPNFAIYVGTFGNDV